MILLLLEVSCIKLLSLETRTLLHGAKTALLRWTAPGLTDTVHAHPEPELTD
jgi:hypothetical protein